MARLPKKQVASKATPKPESPAESWVSSVANDAKPRLLLVDDESVLLKVLELRLKKEGFDVVTLHEGSDSLHDLSQLDAELNRLRPQAVITDYDMGNFTGAALMQEVKRLHPQLPVYLLSGNDDAQREARASSTSVKFDGVFDKADMANVIPAVVDMLGERGIVPVKNERLPGS